jgi:quercetin dioxygenase-like cupin family protein
MQTMFFPDWVQQVNYSEGDMPKPHILAEDEKVKTIMAGLEAGQSIPNHPEAESVYYFLTGKGVMQVDEETYPVEAGSTLIVPDGAVRGLRADTRLAFLAVRIA